MSYNENFKGMLALTYCKQCANMSKQSENTNLTTKNSKQSRYSKGTLGYSQTGNRARAKCGGKKRNATQTQSNCDNVLPPRSATICESTEC